ncbi:MAG: methionine adenosyltransferase [Clostridiales bacterium]|nr:methionine adenosyltransferase [Clostridiales bacterium]
MRKLFTSESVTEGHPDKMCDLIADSILDAYLEKDKDSKVACECVAGKGLILVTGEISSKGKVNIENIVRNVIKNIGYKDEDINYNGEEYKVIVNISEQSKEIKKGIKNSVESKENNNIDENVHMREGAGDQGMVFGFATDETEVFMPLPIYLAHRLAEKITEVRKNNIISFLKPDGKVQVTVEYEDNKPIRVDTIVVSVQHQKNIDMDFLRKEIKEKVIKTVIDKSLLDSNTKYFINAMGEFTIGGPIGDTGLTGRKIIVDTYGSFSRHGGGAFSGKDATKVDRSGAYMARYIAKNLVANKYAKKCEIQISYVIGFAKPVSVYVDSFGTGIMSDKELADFVICNFDLTPSGIIDFLKLKDSIYSRTTNYGHFGRQNFSWEEIIEL